MRQELLRSGTDQLLLNLMDHGRPATPASCTYRILDVGGNVLDSGTATGGVCTPSAGVVGQARQDCTVEWSYTYGGTPVKKAEQFDVVLFKLYPVASEDELIREAPALLSSERVQRCAVTAADASSVTDRTLIGTREDWVGSVLTFLTGAGQGTQFVVTAFDPITGKVTFPATATATAGDTFLLRRSFQPELDAAWEDIYDRLVQSCSGAPGGLGYQSSRPYLIMTPDRLRRPHILLALSKAFRGIATDTQGADWARADLYRKDYEEAWNGLKFVFAQAGNTTNPTPDGERSAQWGFGR